MPPAPLSRPSYRFLGSGAEPSWRWRSRHLPPAMFLPGHLRTTWFALALLALLSVSAGCQEHSGSSGVIAFEPEFADVVDSGPWSGWRGGPRQGCAHLAGDWALDTAPQTLWKAVLPGSGNSSPTLVGPTILLTAEIPSPSPEASEAELALVALDAETGSERWVQRVGRARGPTHSKTGYAAATIAASSELGFAFFGESGLICFDVATGQVRWRREFPRNRHEWGIVSSPVLYRNLVIQLVDGEQGESFLAAFDQQSGQPMWSTPRASHGCWTTPLLITSDEATGLTTGTRDAGDVSSRNPVATDGATPQLVVNGTGHKDGSAGWVISYDPRNGEELWRARGTSDIAVPTALAWKGHVISTSGGNGPIFSVRYDGRGDVTATHLRWKLPTGGPYVPTGLVVDERLYLLTDGGVVSCRDAASGERLGRQRLAGTYTSSLIGAGQYLIAVNEAGDLFFLEQNEELSVVASLSLHERCLATPAMAGNRLYLRTAQHLYCLEMPPSVPAETVDRPDPSGEVAARTFSPSAGDRAEPMPIEVLDRVDAGIHP